MEKRMQPSRLAGWSPGDGPPVRQVRFGQVWRRSPAALASGPPGPPPPSPPASHPAPPRAAPAPTPPAPAPPPPPQPPAPTPSAPAQSPAGSPQPAHETANPPPPSGHTTCSTPTPTPTDPAPAPALASSLSLEQAETLDRFATVGQSAARRVRPGSVRDALHGVVRPGRIRASRARQRRRLVGPATAPQPVFRYPGAERRGPGSSARRWRGTPAGRRAAGQRAREGQALAASSGAGLHSGGPRMRPRR